MKSLKYTYQSFTLKPTDRIIITSNSELTRLRNVSSQRPAPKPTGLWYAFGNSWKLWAVDAQWEVGDYYYKIDVNTSTILRLSNKKDVINFSFKYSHYEGVIDWRRVAKDYSGIEFNPYNKSWISLETIGLLSWYTSIDVPSGCVWKSSAVKSIDMITEVE